MTNDKDSAVLAEKANIEWLAQQLLDWPDKRTDEAKTMAIGTLHRMASATILSQHQELAALRQPTQSDALLEGDAQTILYLLGVRHGREDERAKIVAERQAGYAAGVEAAAKALEADAMKCDCAALEERECGCGAWCEWKSITSARAVEIVRELKKIPPPEGDGGHRRSDGGD